VKLGLFEWFFYSGSSWSDRDRQRNLAARREAKARRLQAKNRLASAKKAQKKHGFFYWE